MTLAGQRAGGPRWQPPSVGWFSPGLMVEVASRSRGGLGFEPATRSRVTSPGTSSLKHAHSCCLTAIPSYTLSQSLSYHKHATHGQDDSDARCSSRPSLNSLLLVALSCLICQKMANQRRASGSAAVRGLLPMFSIMVIPV
jgi:hypothetical protein